MSFDYATSKATADRLIARFGQSAALLRPVKSGPAYNPTEGEPERHACTVAVLEYTSREIDGTRILATDKKVYLAVGSLTITPGADDALEIGGVKHRIIGVKPLNPAGTVVYYELQVRR